LRQTVDILILLCVDVICRKSAVQRTVRYLPRNWISAVCSLYFD